MNEDKITQALTKMFERNRIVFWYDGKKESRDIFNAVEIENIEKIEIKNNEFGIKYKILREQPKQKFLIYKEDEQPEHIDNWLLDVQLSQAEFKTDLVARSLSELELGPEFYGLFRSHQPFFSSTKRLEALKRIITSNDSDSTIQMKMLAICCDLEGPRIDSVLEQLLSEYSEGKDTKINLIKKINLEEFLWKQIKIIYNYQSDAPSIEEFAIELFKSSYALELHEDNRLNNDALVFLKRWKDSIRFKESFEKLSAKSADILNIEEDLHNRTLKDLKNIDFFELIEKRILFELSQQVCASTITAEKCSLIIRERRTGHWFSNYENLYEAIENASKFIHLLKTSDFEITSLKSGFENYNSKWYRIDQLYRKFIYHVLCSQYPEILNPLKELIENFYSNNFLLPLGDSWQIHIDKMDTWNIPDVVSQRDFFKKYVQSFPDNHKKIAVVISDALRYEVAEEFLSLIRQEDRYDATLTPMLSSLPSYTQLGMASLLPNTTLEFVEGNKAHVLVDGKNTVGTIPRAKILKENVKNGGTAITAEKFLEMNRDESRSLIKENDVVYIYHDEIDDTGDKKKSEGKTFIAVEETLKELMKIVKRLTGANINNLIITADHGFIYQNNVLDKSDFSTPNIDYKNIIYEDRRFLLGRKMTPNNDMKLFESKDVGLKGEIQILIPKSINRLRLQGSGSRFVHGGATLQEITVPVLAINKRRESDVKQVNIEIIRGSSSIITSGQFSVVFFQEDVVNDKIQPRFLRVGIYTQEGKLISDSHELRMDLTTENPREREVIIRFLLSSDADSVNGQEVILKLEERFGTTSLYKEYKSVRYLIRRSFTSDFDF